MRGQLDPVFSSKDEHKSEQDMYRYWNASFSELCTTLFNSQENYIILHTIQVSALEIVQKVTMQQNSNKQ